MIDPQARRQVGQIRRSGATVDGGVLPALDTNSRSGRRIAIMLAGFNCFISQSSPPLLIPKHRTPDPVRGHRRGDLRSTYSLTLKTQDSAKTASSLMSRRHVPFKPPQRHVSSDVFEMPITAVALSSSPGSKHRQPFGSVAQADEREGSQSVKNTISGRLEGTSEKAGKE